MNGSLTREAYFPTFIHDVDLADGSQINAALQPQIYSWRAQEPSGPSISRTRRPPPGVRSMTKTRHTSTDDDVVADGRRRTLTNSLPPGGERRQKCVLSSASADKSADDVVVSG